MQKFKGKMLQSEALKLYNIMRKKLEYVDATSPEWSPKLSFEIEVYDAVPVRDPVDELTRCMQLRRGQPVTQESVLYFKELAQHLIDEGWINPERLK